MKDNSTLVDERVHKILSNYTVEETMEMVEEIRNSNGVFGSESLVRDLIEKHYIENKQGLFHLHLFAVMQDLMFVMNRYVKNLNTNIKNLNS